MLDYIPMSGEMADVFCLLDVPGNSLQSQAYRAVVRLDLYGRRPMLAVPTQ